MPQNLIDENYIGSGNFYSSIYLFIYYLFIFQYELVFQTDQVIEFCIKLVLYLGQIHYYGFLIKSWSTRLGTLPTPKGV